MKLQYLRLAIAAMACQALPGQAQETVKTAPPAQVEVNASLTDTQARRELVAGKIIIGRKRIEESGVRTVEELLKREPAVTVSGDGRIGLLNMPGYTQVLVDGQRPMAGQDPSQLDVVHVEKVEIVKSSVAEYGPFGIAGTINIVTRKTVRKTATQLGTTVSSSAGKPGVNISLSHNQSTEGSPLRFNVELSASQSTGVTDTRIRQTLAEAGQAEQQQSLTLISGHSRSPSLVASGNVTWQRTSAETVTLSPQFFGMRGPSDQDESRRWTDGTALDVHQQSTSSLAIFAMPLKWSFKPSKQSQLDLSVRTNLSRMDTDTARVDASGAQPSTLRNSSSRTEGHSNSVDAAYKLSIDGGHTLKTGANVRRSASDVDYGYRIDGVPDTALLAQGTHRAAVSQHLRWHVQDEWRINDDWALNGGMSAQHTSIDINEALYRARTSFQLWSPSLHLSRQIGGQDARRQMRFSLARSFKAPQDSDFTLRPQVNPLAPCAANGVCGPNTIDNADSSGNPGLRPERAIGLNVSYEHGLGADSQITLELFTRQITGKIGSAITLDDVPWSSAPRYVSRPVNLGDAHTSGINLEMDLAVRDLAKSAPKVTLRSAIGLARSSVASLPGPDNRLDKQTPWTAKLGASYAMQDAPLKFDIDANWTPEAWTRTSLSERVFIARRFDLDTSAKWTISKDRRLVFSFNKRASGTPQQIDEYGVDDQLVRQYSDTRKYNKLSVKFETKL
ncbi:MAG: TonB-dependent receptor [Pseudomonadota bacterium]